MFHLNTQVQQVFFPLHGPLSPDIILSNISIKLLDYCIFHLTPSDFTTCTPAFDLSVSYPTISVIYPEVVSHLSKLIYETIY